MPSGQLPPYYPTNEVDLNRLMSLAGQWAAGVSLSPIAAAWMEKNAGRMPATKREAQEWKIGLKELLSELRDDPTNPDE